MFDLLNPFVFKLSPFFFMNNDGAPGGGDDKSPDAEGNGGTNDGNSQADLDRKFAERAKRAAEAERKAILEALGVTSLDDVKAIISDKRRADDEAKSELQKLTDKVTEKETALDDFKAKSETEISGLRKRVIDTEIKIAASKTVIDKDGKVVRSAFREDAIEDVLLLIDRENIKETEDGKLEGVDKALEALAKSKVYLLAGDKVSSTESKGTPKSRTHKKQPEDREPETYTSVVGNSL